MGALAVALGVGVAIGTTPGTVWAAPDTTDTSDVGGPPAPKPPNETAAQDENAPTTEPDPPADDPEELEPPEQPDDEFADTEPPLQDDEEPAAPEQLAGGTPDGDGTELGDPPLEDLPQIDGDPGDGIEPPPADALDAAYSAAPTDAAREWPAPVVEPDPATASFGMFSAADEVVTLSTPFVAPGGPADLTTDQVAATEPTVNADPITNFFTAVQRAIVGVLSPLLGPATGAPSAPPLVWAVLAWVRRELTNFTTAIASIVPVAQQLTSQLFTGIANAITGFLGGLLNRPPVATPAVTGTDSVTGVVTGTLNATDPNGDPLTYQVAAPPAKGGVQVSPAGVFTYTPTDTARHAAAALTAPTAAKQDAFTIDVADGRGGVTPVTVTVTVLPLNSPPRTPTTGSGIVAGEPDPITGAVSGRVTLADDDQDTLVYSGTGVTPRGQVTVYTDGTFSYAPDPAQRVIATGTQGPDTDVFGVTARDGHGGQTTVQVTVTVLPANGSPVTTGATFGTPDEDGVIVGALNASDPEGATLTYTLATDPALAPRYGTVTLGADGSFSYRPDPEARVAAALSTDVAETDSFVVRVSDGINTPVLITVGNLTVAEARANEVIAVVELTESPRAIEIAPDGGRAYAVNPAVGTVTVINLADNGIADTYEVGGQPLALVLSEDGSKLYVAIADDSGGRVKEIDTASGAVLKVIELGLAGGGNPSGIATSGRFVYTANTNDTISVIDLTQVAPATLAIDPIGIAVNSDGSYAYAVNANTGQLQIVRTSDGFIEDVLAVGTDPFAVVVHPDDTYVYVTNTGDNSVSVIRLSDHFVTTINGVGNQPHGIDITPDGTHLYVASYGDDRVAIIDLADGSVTYTAIVGDGPWDIDINGAGTQATVTNSLDNTIAVLLIVGNEDPAVSSATVQTPVNGVVAVAITATDPDGDTLTYSVTQDALRGSVTADGVGGFTYTPSAPARALAAATPGVDTDTFEVTVDDGQGGRATLLVDIEIAPTAVVSEVALSGGNAATSLTPDGSRLIVATNVGTDTVISIFDAATNTRIAPDLTVTGYPAGWVDVSPDGSRAVITTLSFDGTIVVRGAVIDTETGALLNVVELTDNYLSGHNVTFSETGDVAAFSSRSQVAIIDMATGQQVGSTIVTGEMTAAARVSADGTRVVVTSMSPFDAAAQAYHITVNVYDTASLAQVGSSITADSTIREAAPVFNAEGTRAVIAFNGSPGNSTQFKSIDVVNGVQLGNTLYVPGQLPSNESGIIVVPDGSRAILSTIAYGQEHRTVVVDTATMTALGTTTTYLNNYGYRTPILSPDATRVLITTSEFFTGTDATLLDVATGATLGSVQLSGEQSGAGFGADGARAYVIGTSPTTHELAVFDSATGSSTIHVYQRVSADQLYVSVDSANTRVLSSATPNSGGRDIRVINPETGAQIGSTTTVPSGTIRDVHFDPAGNLAVVAIESAALDGSYATRIVVIDTAAGGQVGSTIALDGSLPDFGIQYSSDGRRAAYSTVATAGFGPSIARVAVLDVSTGTQFGETITHHGYPAGFTPSMFIADGNYLTTVTSDQLTTNETRVTLIALPFTNSPPRVTVDTGSPVNGVVAVQLTATDVNADPLSFTVTQEPTKGSVVGDGVGGFTYTASAPARHAAAATTGVDTDTFTVTVEDGQGGRVPVRVIVEVSPQNADPIITVTPTAASPAGVALAGSDGTVTGRIVATDVDGDLLTYAVAQQPLLGGSVVFGADGAFTYTPTFVLREQAATTPQVDSDRFQISVRDGFGAVMTTDVVVQILPAGVIGETAYNTTDTVSVSPDRTRALTVFNTSDPLTGNTVQKLAVVDTTIGKQIGTPIAIDGLAFSKRFTDDGARAVVTVTDSTASKVIVIDLATGNQIGATVQIPGTVVTQSGFVLAPAQWNQSQTLAVIATKSYADPNGFGFIGSLAVVDLTTGVQVGTPVTLPGEPIAAPTFTRVGNRDVVVFQVFEGETDLSRIVVIDANSGAAVAPAVVAAAKVRMMVSADGSRIVTVGESFESGSIIGHLTIIDTETGTQLGSASGEGGMSRPQLSPDGSRVAVTLIPNSGGQQSLLVFDAADGSPVGTPIALTGGSSESLQFSPDGSRLLVLSTDVTGTHIVIVDVVSGGLINEVFIDQTAYRNNVWFNESGTRATALTYSGTTLRVTVVDTVAGAVVGSPEIANRYNDVEFSPDGTRAVVTTYTGSVAGLSLVDTTTGEIVGIPLVIAGQPRNLQFYADGQRIAITTVDSSQVRAAMVDVATGLQIGETISIAASTGRFVINARGDRGALYDDRTTGNSNVLLAIVDTENGTPRSYWSASTKAHATFSDDGEVLVVTGMHNGYTQVSVYDTDWGHQIGSPYSVYGDSVPGSVRISPDGGHIAFVTQTSPGTSTLTVVHTVNAGYIADPITVQDQLRNPAWFSGSSVFMISRTSGADTVIDVLKVNRIPSVTLTVADPQNGAVVVDVQGTDPDGDVLYYNVTRGPAQGSVTGDFADAYVYTPTAAARSAASATPYVDYDTFTVSVNDYRGGGEKLISVQVEIAPTAVVSELSLPGSGDAAYSADGSLAVVGTSVDNTTVVSVVNTASNTPVGQSVTIAGAQRGHIKVTADGSRAVVVTFSAGQTQATVINTSTGAQIGNTVVLTGEPVHGAYSEGDDTGPIRLSVDGDRAAVTTAGFIAIIDTETGLRVGDLIATTGQTVVPARLSADGTRLTATAFGGSTITVSVYDATTATPIGSTVIAPSDNYQVAPLFNANGSRAYITTTLSGSTEVRAIDTVSGEQSGATVVLPGTRFGNGTLTVGDSRLVVTTRDGDASSVVVVDTATMAQIGTTTTLVGSWTESSPLFNGAGTRAVHHQFTADHTTHHYAIIDVETGTQTGATVVLTGAPNEATFSQDGDQVSVVLETGAAFTVAVFDTATGSADTVEYQRNPNETMKLFLGSANNRAVVVTGFPDPVTGENQARIHVVDSTTGMAIGSPVATVGAFADIRLSADGNRAIVMTQDTGSLDTYGMRFVVLDVTSGTQVGDTLFMHGAPIGYELGITFSPDGNRVAYDTYQYLPDGGIISHLLVFDAVSGEQLGDILSRDGVPANTRFSADGGYLTAAVRTQATPGSTLVSRIALAGSSATPGDEATTGGGDTGSSGSDSGDDGSSGGDSGGDSTPGGPSSGGPSDADDEDTEGSSSSGPSDSDDGEPDHTPTEPDVDAPPPDDEPTTVPSAPDDEPEVVAPPINV